MTYSKQSMKPGYIKPYGERPKGYSKQANGFVEVTPRSSGAGHTSFVRAARRRASFGR